MLAVVFFLEGTAGDLITQRFTTSLKITARGENDQLGTSPLSGTRSGKPGGDSASRGVRPLGGAGPRGGTAGRWGRAQAGDRCWSAE